MRRFADPYDAARELDALRERLAAAEVRYLDLRKRTPPDCTVENFTKMGAQLVVMSQRLAAAERVVEAARNVGALGTWHRDGGVTLTLTAETEDEMIAALVAWDALSPTEKPHE